MAAVDPERLVARCLVASGATVRLRAPGIRLALDRDQLWVAAVGKAAIAMARGAARRVPGIAGMAIAPRSRSRRPAAEGSLGAIRVAFGEHPVPGRGSFAATRRLVRAIAELPQDAVVLLLLSGGASALLAMPATGIRPADEVSLNRILLRSGLAVDRMNAIRKAASAVKGGGLLRLAAPRRMITLAISDVPGDALATIGSGPGIPHSTPGRALAAALRELDPAELPAAIRRFLAARGRRPAPRRTDATTAPAAVIGSNAIARRAAAARARALGYHVRYSSRPLSGPAAQAGIALARALPRRPRRPTAVIAGGETVVDARGARGRGGRSQELALAAATALAGSGWTLLAAGTDGIDGQTPAAGAIVDGGTVRRGGLDGVARALAEHDSYRYFARRGGLLITGPTGTNVMDLVIALHPGEQARGGRSSGGVVRAHEATAGRRAARG